MMHNRCEACAKTGRNAVELVGTFPQKFPSVRYFYFKAYEPRPGVEERLNVRNVRTLAGLLIGELLAHYPNAADLIEQMLRGINVQSTGEIEVSAADLTSRLPQLEAECRLRGEALALYSMCRKANGNKLHIPMMDFRIESGDDIGQLNLLIQALTRLGQEHGVLLDSGKSYHYYGFKPLKEPEWQRFIAACLLLEPLVDVRYIAHRMLEGKAALRLTTVPRKPKSPEVVACLHPNV